MIISKYQFKISFPFFYIYIQDHKKYNYFSNEKDSIIEISEIRIIILLGIKQRPFWMFNFSFKHHSHWSEVNNLANLEVILSYTVFFCFFALNPACVYSISWAHWIYRKMFRRSNFELKELGYFYFKRYFLYI